MSSLLIRNGVVITMNDAFDIVQGDISIRDGRIAAVGSEPDRSPAAHDAVVDAHGGWVLPGFVQTHVHLCQTLFRGSACRRAAGHRRAPRVRHHHRADDGDGA